MRLGLDSRRDGDGGPCECDGGPCCDGCHLLGTESRCSEDPVSFERECGPGGCGADVVERRLFRHCSGRSTDCPTDVLREGPAEVVEDCEASELCVFLETGPSCSPCAEGCAEGRCVEEQCSTGPCCEASRFAPTTARCSDTEVATECRCTGSECGSDLECRSQHRYCTGASADCTDAHLEWEGWELSEACSPDQICEAAGTVGLCTTCEHGCGVGSCVEPACVLWSQSGCRDPSCSVAGACAPARALIAGEDHTCAVLESGAVRCWGGAFYGQLGYGNRTIIGDDERPATARDIPVGGAVTQLGAGFYHTCAVLDSGAVRCWGYAGQGQLGYGNIDYVGDDALPSTAGDVSVGGRAVQIGAGMGHTCALLDSGAVRCWGTATFGRLGYGNETEFPGMSPAFLPSDAGDVSIGGVAVQIELGGWHTCALLATGGVRCWGNGEDGRLGYGDTASVGDDELPAAVGEVDVGGTVVQIAAGWHHTCALLDTGAVRCWGLAAQGQLGYGSTASIGDDEAPSSAGDVPVGCWVAQIAVGASHTCALCSRGSVRCWGDGADGELGYGDTDSIGDDETPSSAGDVAVGGTVVQIAAGFHHTCALLETGAIRCWGRGADGRLGYGDTRSVGDDELPSTAGDVPFL